MKKWGLALGGGGILGLAHIGVLQALNDMRLEPDVLTGASAGAIVAGLYACGVGLQQTADSLAFATLGEGGQGSNEPSLPGELGEQVRPLAFSGLIGGWPFEAAIDRITKGARLKDVKIPIAITSVDIITGSIVVFTNKPPKSSAEAEAFNLAGRVYVSDAKVSQALRASFSVPGMFVPKKFGPWALVDGGVRDMVPAYEARRLGAEEVVAIDLSLHVERPHEVGTAIGVLSRSFALASRERTEIHLKEWASIILEPDVWESGLPTPTKLRALVNAGAECVRLSASRLKAILGFEW